MNVFQTCSDIVDAVPLSTSQRLYLKPIARFNISVQLPQTKRPGKTISNWEVMEKMKSMIKPEEFTVLKVSKSTLEFIRFECEIENKRQLSNVIIRLDGRTIKLAGFPELLKLRAAEAKIPYPTRHTWDSYFRDAKNMNEMKPGERPDTIHISNLPCKWFASKQDRKETKDVPSEYILKKVFEIFGDVRCVDIPISDPYRSQMKSNISGIKTFSFGQELSFEAYVQFKEYVCFVKAMDALRGMKLLYKEGDKAFTASIKVDFDRTKHMSDVSIRRRRIERDKLMGKERDLEEKIRREQEEEERRREEDRLRKLEEKQERVNRRKSREEKRKCNQLKKLRDVAAQEMNEKIAIEERKLLIAQRKLESIRLLDELFERVKEVVKQRGTEKRDDSMTRPVPVEDKEAAKLRKKEERARTKRERLQDKERQLRDKLVHKYKCAQERTMYTQREKLRFTKLRSVLAATSTTIDVVRSKNTNIDTEDSSEDTSDVTSTELNESRETSWTEKQGFDDNNFHMGAQYKDQQWYPPNNYQSHYPHPGFYNNNPRYQYRGRGFYPRRRRFYHPFRQPFGRGRGQQPNFYDYDQEYYRYFQKFSKSDKNGDKDNDANYEKSSYHTHSYSYSSPSRSHSRHRSRSQSRHRSRTPTRSRSRHRSRTPTRSRSRHRSRSPSRSRSRHRSRSSSRSRSRHRSRTLSKSRSRHQSRTPSRSRSIQRSRTPSRPHSRHRSRTPSKSKTISQSQPRSRLRSRSHSKTSSKSHSLSRTHIETSPLFKLQQSQTKSWSRSRSGSKSRKKTYSRSHSKSPPKGVLRSRSVSKNNNMAWSDVSLESLGHSHISHKMESGISNHSKKPSKHKKNKKKVKKMGKHKKSKTEKIIDDN